MTQLLTGIGLVLVIEGIVYAGAPGSLKRLMAQMQRMSDDGLRIGGAVAVAIGVALVWLATMVDRS